MISGSLESTKKLPDDPKKARKLHKYVFLTFLQLCFEKPSVLKELVTSFVNPTVSKKKTNMIIELILKNRFFD